MSAEHHLSKTDAFLLRHGMDAKPIPAVATAFVQEMERGLAGEPSSLDMIPTYLSAGIPVLGRRAAVVDAGGTNFRASRVFFGEKGPELEYVERAPMPGTESPVSWEEFIEFSARKIIRVMEGCSSIGFCFSFRADITPERDGRVILMSKGVQISGYEGRYICADLREALRRMGAKELPSVLVNDTAAVLLSGTGLLMSEGYDSLIGLVCGTGQNTCCTLDISRIGKLGAPGGQNMLVNLESGCFSLIEPGDFDRELDAASVNPGDHVFEKMTSGAYLGELCRLTLKGAAREGLLSDEGAERVHSIATLSSADADMMASVAPKLYGRRDGCVVRDICRAVFSRAARYVCANIAAILILTDNGKDPEHPACVCADGSVVRHSRVFSSELRHYMDSSLRAVLGRHCVLHTLEEATTLGTASAALLNT